ncbi:hypothetical protein D3C76_1410010 [compost metagenome]
MADDVVDTHAQACDSGVGHFIEDRCQVRWRTTRAAVFDRHVRQDHAHFTGSQPGGAVGLVLLAPLVFQRREVVGDEATDAVGKGHDVVVKPGRTVVIEHGVYLENLIVSALRTPLGAGAQGQGV